MNLKVGDLVIAIAGKDKGKTGKITKTIKAENKVIVEGLNAAKKHVKPNGQSNGTIADINTPIHVSNVMLVDPKTKKGTRIGYKTDKNGKKVRYAKKSNEVL
jgi:large subunit ribosomal protein L24